MKLNIDIKELDCDIIAPFIDMEFDLNISQLNNLGIYLDLLVQYKNPKKIITNHDNIMQAINYDMDENREYWFILDKQFYFMDVGIPHNMADKMELYDNLTEFEIELVKSVMSC
jgi:hypothetical protein